MTDNFVENDIKPRIELASFLSREAILGVKDLVIEKFDVPEWGGHIFIRALTAKERDQFEKSNYKKLTHTTEAGKKGEYDLNLDNIRARLFVLTACSEDGTRLFNDFDAEALGAKNAAVIDRGFEIARRLSGITKEDVEELAGNSARDLSGSSSSA